MKDPFVHLHCHTTYSFQDGYGHPADFARRAASLGQGALAVTDHGNISAHRKTYDACKANGIKPILGLEAYICDNSLAKVGRERWHITLLARDLEGYRNLLKLTTLSWEPHRFYYKPRIDWDMLGQYSKGLIGTSGCPGGKIGRGITKGNWTIQNVESELKRQAALFDDGAYYAELSHWSYNDGVKVASAVYNSAIAVGLPMILTADCHYPAPEDAQKQDVLLCIQNNCLFSDPQRMKFSQDDFCVLSGDDMAKAWHKIHGKKLPGLDDMVLNTSRIAESVNFEFPTSTPLKFPFNGDRLAYLKALCEEGMTRRGVAGQRNYTERLDYEFGLVVSKDFVDYFLIVSDLIVWAKNNEIFVGPARGSSCGSLMCYLLRITEIDPLRHNLMFERFIDVSRKDLPDIDIDFESERRGEVKDYMAQKYGNDRVASLATYGTFKGRLCLQDIGRVFADKIPTAAIEETKRLVIQRSSADSRAGYTIEDTFTNFDQAAEHLKKYPELGLAKVLEGQVRQLGVHAAGVVVSNEPIGDFAATYVTSKGDRVISMDYSDVTSVGLLKIDILGLTVLTAIKRILKLVEQRHKTAIDLYAVPLDDQEVYQNFCGNHLQGIFQFDGPSTRQVCRQIQPDTFKQLTAVNALSRPGPLHANGTTNYIERRWGRQKVESLHPILDEVTKDTYGIVVYQEQVMQVVRRLGKFDWGETASIRKAMSKKLGDEFFAKMREKFVQGAVSQNTTEAVALEVWQNICTMGSWAFNLLHSVAYSTLAYQLMWLKTHYPLEFYAGVISCENDDEKKRRLLKEYTNTGGKLLPVDINESKPHIACGETGLRLGFDSITGLGDEAIKPLLKDRPFKDFVDFRKRCPVSEAVADKLLKVGAFRNLNFEYISEQHDLFGADKAQGNGFDYKNPSEQDLLAFCPLMVENKTRQVWEAWVKKNVEGKLWSIREIDDITDRDEVMIVGRTNPSTSFNLKNKMEEAASRGLVWTPKEGEANLTKEQYSFLNFDLEDETDAVIVRVSYKMYPRFKELLWAIKSNDAIGVRGMVNGQMRMVFAHNIVNLTSLRPRVDGKLKGTRLEHEFLSGKRDYNR